jgi:hypothetical protein
MRELLQVKPSDVAKQERKDAKAKKRKGGKKR